MKCENLAESFSSYFKVIYANTSALLKEVYKIRYDVFCAELKLEEDCPPDVEKDDFDRFAHHFLLQHRATGEYAGTVRYIVPPAQAKPKITLPLEKFCSHALDPAIVSPAMLVPGVCGEVSRLAVPARFRKRAGEQGRPYIVDAMRSSDSKSEKRLFPYIAVGLYLAPAAVAFLRDIEYTYIMVEPRLARAMAAFGIKFNRAGEVVEYHGRRAPYYITRQMLLENLKPQLRDLFFLIRSDLEKQFSANPITKKAG